MTKAELKPIILAWLNGQPIQWRYNEHAPWEDEDLTASENLPTVPNFNGIDWRIKPEKKLRPWKPEEVPISGVLYRTKERPDHWFLVKETYLSSGVRYIVLELSRGGFHTRDLFNVFESSIDDGVSWHPCGIEE